MQDGISPFRFWVQPILPLAYDDSLSYLEVLLKVKIKLNEVIDWANNYKDELYQYVDQKTAENLTQMQQQLEAYQSLINSRLTQQDNKISSLEGSINGILTTVNQLISQFQTDINKQIAQFQLDTNTTLREFQTDITNQINNNEAWVKAQIAAQNSYVNAQLVVINQAIKDNLIAANKYTDDAIQEALSQLEPGVSDVTYPDDYQKMTIQEAINRLWYDLSFFTLTAEEYDNLTLDASVYDDKELTAYQYDLYGKWYLIYQEQGGGSSSLPFDIPAITEDTIGAVLTAESQTETQWKYIDELGILIDIGNTSIVAGTVDEIVTYRFPNGQYGILTGTPKLDSKILIIAYDPSQSRYYQIKFATAKVISITTYTVQVQLTSNAAVFGISIPMNYLPMSQTDSFRSTGTATVKYNFANPSTYDYSICYVQGNNNYTNIPVYGFDLIAYDGLHNNINFSVNLSGGSVSYTVVRTGYIVVGSTPTEIVFKITVTNSKITYLNLTTPDIDIKQSDGAILYI